VPLLSHPVPFEEAIQTLSDKAITPSAMDSAAWSAVPAAIRQRAFFSATVEDARFLQAGRDFLNDFLTQATVKLPDGQVAMKVGGRGDFVTQMKEFMHKTGVERSKDETITDIGGSNRLRLIFDTQVRMAHDYGNYKQGLDPDMLEQFPALRFIRGEPVEVPRPLHDENEGEVRLKTDEAFWLAMNDPELGGFGVPYGPWGFNSGMDVEEVSREEAVELGLIEDGENHEHEEALPFNDGLAASTDGLDDDVVEGLKENLGDDANLVSEEGEVRLYSDAEPMTKLADGPLPTGAPPYPVGAPSTEPLAVEEAVPRLIAPLPVAATPLAEVEEALVQMEREPEKATELAREIVAEDEAATEKDNSPLAVFALAWAMAWLAGDRPLPLAGPDAYDVEEDDGDGLPA
jgi:hypothetical protein